MKLAYDAAADADIEPLLTAEEVSKIFRVSIDTVYAYARNGKLPKIQLDRAVRFRRVDVLTFIERAALPARLVARR